MKIDLKNYYRRIRRCLPWGGKRKKQIMETIEQTVAAYVEETPGADMTAVERHFGTPQQIAAAYIDEMTTPEILKKFKLRRTIVLIICSAAAIALVLWGAALAAALIENYDAHNGYYEIFITEG